MKLFSKILCVAMLSGVFNAAAAELVGAQSYGASQAMATANVISEWRRIARSNKTPYVRCQQIYVGPGWVCYATGYA
ncbi:hypothetical protein J8M21_04840 [Pseudoalteromonas luteoviolacea]|uniref:hypothetical protein n=1 Tax=Pseudoalteromonas luteoviolacea TaxID=43657 RepID=UPI001B39F8AE|nr:hypothetical protein [Pseudoalteromonas luteoviolacea]MBQ4876535.1 hypothetical protein [Pseudoalteromonas luteoviolacea]MBQ4905166.1 hypothetical protein [Pseudoalteromonas luteoviolacea]